MLIVDDSTIEIILQKHKLPQIVVTPIYPLVYEYLFRASPNAQPSKLFSHISKGRTLDALSCNVAPSVRIVEAARLLNDNGFIFEAGSLILLLQNTHSIFRNISNAFTVGNKFFH